MNNARVLFLTIWLTGISLPGIAQYCIPGCMMGGAACVKRVHIPGTTLDAYTSDFNCYNPPTPINPGHTGTLIAGTPYTIVTALDFVSDAAMWIDYDHNGSFDASEYTPINTSSGLGTFTVPALAQTGQTGLRIIGNAMSSLSPPEACNASIMRGDVEDYTITIVAPSPCPHPVNVAISMASASVADISWTQTGAAAQWELEYGASGFAQGTGTRLRTGNNPYSLSLPTPGLDYDVYLRAVCGAADTSLWVGPYRIKGLCPEPQQVVVSNVTAYSADVAWAQGTATQWELEYDTAGFIPGTGNLMVLSNNGFSIMFANPVPGTIYDIYIRAICGAGDTSLRVGPFKAKEPCPDPDNIVVSSTTMNTALISWNQAGSAAQWILEYDTTGFIPGTGNRIAVAANPYTLLLPAPGTIYDVYLRSVCNPGDTSRYAGPVQVITLRDCASDTLIVCNEQHTVSLPAGNGVWNIPACALPTPGKEKGFRFTAPASGLYTLTASSATGSGISYFYKEAAAGCTDQHWTCILSSASGGSDTFRLTGGMTYYLLADNMSASSASSQDIRISCPDSSNGIGRMAHEQPFSFSAHPNPAHTYVILNFSGTIAHDASVSVTDVTGRLLLRKRITGNGQQLDISAFRNGVYFICYRDTRQTVTINIKKQ